MPITVRPLETNRETEDLMKKVYDFLGFHHDRAYSKVELMEELEMELSKRLLLPGVLEVLVRIGAIVPIKHDGFDYYISPHGIDELYKKEKWNLLEPKPEYKDKIRKLLTNNKLL